MKKLFFAFVATSVVVLSACNNKPAESETPAVDSTAVVEEVVAVVDSAVAVVDSTVATEPAK